MVGKQYPCDLLFPVRFWSAHPADTLLSRKATEDDSWLDVWRIELMVVGLMTVTTKGQLLPNG